MSDSPLEQTLAVALAGQTSSRTVDAAVDISRRAAGAVIDLSGHEPGQATT